MDDLENIIVTGRIIGYCCGVLIILAVIFYQRQKKSRGAPDSPPVGGGYCMNRIQGRVGYALTGGLFLLLGMAFLVYGWNILQSSELLSEQKPWWEGAGAIALGIGCVILGGWVIYAETKGILRPEKSLLAQSIRSQLPHPDEAPPAAQLFAMVDQDIKKNGQWFDRVAVGREWVLGDEASYIPRIRVVLGRDTIRMRGNGRPYRIIQLLILDDRRQWQISDLRNPKELSALIDCLRLRAPAALFGDYEHHDFYQKLSEEKWAELERDYQKRGQEQARSRREPVGQREQNVILTRADGSITSRLDAQVLEWLLEETAPFRLEAGRPMELGGRRFADLWCVPRGGARLELFLRERAGQSEQSAVPGLRRMAGREEARQVLIAWTEQKSFSLEGWEPIQFQALEQEEEAESREVSPAVLELQGSQGLCQSHKVFTLEDIRLAAEGLVSGRYRMIHLVLEGGYLLMRIESGDQRDGGCTVSITRPVGNELRFYETKCTHQQGADWFLEFARGSFQPNLREWKDCTKQVSRK